MNRRPATVCHNCHYDVYRKPDRHNIWRGPDDCPSCGTRLYYPVCRVEGVRVYDSGVGFHIDASEATEFKGTITGMNDVG